MARYTQTDYTNALAARRDIALGVKAVSVSIAGKSITYQQSSQAIQLLDRLITEIEIDLGLVSLRTYAKNAGRATS